MRPVLIGILLALGASPALADEVAPGSETPDTESDPSSDAAGAEVPICQRRIDLATLEQEARSRVEHVAHGCELNDQTGCEPARWLTAEAAACRARNYLKENNRESPLGEPALVNSYENASVPAYWQWHLGHSELRVHVLSGEVEQMFIPIRGRPLGGAQQPLAATEGGAGWTPPEAGPGSKSATLTTAMAAQVAQAWLADARAEHASISSFARHLQELMSLGAPAELLWGVQRGIGEEIAHAELCFAQVARFGGAAQRPGPLPAAPARVGLEAIARALVLEGCIEETLAAAECNAALEAATDAEVRAALTTIVEDESRHAALAWQTLHWLWPQLGAELRAELIGLVEAEIATPPRALPEESGPSLAAWGVIGEAARQRVRAEARLALLAPSLTAFQRAVAGA